MAGYCATGKIPDYVIDPSIRKTWNEWMAIFYPDKKPWWSWIGRIWTEWKYRR